MVSVADGRKIRIFGQRLLSNRTVTCLTNIEAFSLRAADIEEVTSLFARFLRKSRVQGAIRFLLSTFILKLDSEACFDKYSFTYIRKLQSCQTEPN